MHSVSVHLVLRGVWHEALVENAQGDILGARANSGRPFSKLRSWSGEAVFETALRVADL